jgi:hypothetical protein
VRIAYPPVASALIALTGCGYQAPALPTPRDATEITASFGRTWDAVIDEFADRNIPIRTIERASGLIASELLTISHDARGEADCGELNGRAVYPTHAIYNVLVRGDSSRATVKATMRWVRVSGNESVTCSTLHRWESGLEDLVKRRAERPAASRPVRDNPARTATRSVPEPAPAPVEPTAAPAAPAPAGVGAVRFTCEGVSSAPRENPEDELRRLYVGDLRRLGLVDCVEQIPPDLVRVMVGPKFNSVTSEERDVRFERLRGRYGSWGAVVVELWTGTGKFAEYGTAGYQEVRVPRVPRWADSAAP